VAWVDHPSGSPRVCPGGVSEGLMNFIERAVGFSKPPYLSFIP